jgi:hypothetical protein
MDFVDELIRYCPECGQYMKPTKLSNYKSRFCRNCYRIWTEEELIKILKKNGLNSNFCVAMEDTAVPILTMAAKMGQGSIARWLLNNKADPDVCNGEPLENAILTANNGLLKLLLKFGANPNSGKGRLLILAAKKNLMGALEELVNHGGIITKKLSQELFDIAHRNNNYDMIRYISDRSAMTAE